MMVGGKVGQMRLDLGDDLRVLGPVAPLPERGAEVVVLDVFALAIQNQLREATLAIGLDGLRGQRG